MSGDHDRWWAGRLLVSTPALLDPNFRRTVVLLLDHDEDGALGVVLDRPLELGVGEVLPGWEGAVTPPDVLFGGGPVSTGAALGVAVLASGTTAAPLGWRRMLDDTGLIDLDAPVEVVADAFGCSYQGRMIGNFGRAEVLSFHATKVLNTFEGGAVITNDDDLATRMRDMRNLGFRRLDDVVCLGTNGKMIEVSAAMGLTGLESMADFIGINQRHYAHYRRELSGIPGIRLLAFSDEERSNYQYIVVEVEAAQTGLTRDELVRILHAENVRARRYFFPGCHRMPPYRDLYPDSGKSLPETERLTESFFCLPTGSTLEADDIAGICRILQLAVAHAAELRPLLAGEPRWLTIEGEEWR